MLREICKGKIHRARVTEANLNYMGSITIDESLMKAAGIIPFEKVQVVNINDGARFDTYVIKGKVDSGTICLNGAAAHLAKPGDKVIIISYAMMDENEWSSVKPKIVFVDEKNKIKEIGEETPQGC